MAEAQKEERATRLAAQAIELGASGREEVQNCLNNFAIYADRLQEAARALREAASLAPEHAQVKAAFEKIQKDQNDTLYRLCSMFVLENNEEAGQDALSYLARSAKVSADIATKCMDLVAKPVNGVNQEVQDAIVASLLRESLAAKAYLAKKLNQCQDNLAFEEIYGIGDGAANGIATILLDTSVWSKEEDRERCEKEIFLLYLAKLLEVGDEHNGRALKAISRLLAADAAKLNELMDEMCFEAVLTSLDDRNPVEVRSQATLATAKYLEVSKTGQKTLINFVTSRVARQYNEDLVLAFSAAAGVFPVAPSIASSLFLTDGFLQSLIPLVERKAKSEKVERATLDMLNAACIDSGCREAIRKHCMPWLHRILDRGRGQRPGIAAVILAKCSSLASQDNNMETQIAEGTHNIDHLVSELRTMMADESLEGMQNAIEGLAFTSVKPKVKDLLANDAGFLHDFLIILSQHSRLGSSLAFGGLTLIDNLTRYRSNLSDDQRRMNQLKAYANASKQSAQADPLDEVEAVTKRCKAVEKAGTVATLVNISRHLTPGSLGIGFNVLLSLSRTPSLRGSIVQQGGAKLLLQNYTSIKGTSSAEVEARSTAAHALARILISVDPTHAFPLSGSVSLTSAIRPLVLLLTEDSAMATEGPRDMLPTFEALLALTNIASVPSYGAPEMIIRLAFPIVEDLILSNNEHIQRAATELVCNLSVCPKGIELYADESMDADRRMHVLLAMADIEDTGTRRAAGGALASLTQFEGAVKALLKVGRGVSILLGLCEDQTEDALELVHRGVMCISNIVCMERSTTMTAIQKVKELGGLDIVKQAAMKYQDNEMILGCAVPALQVLSGERH